MSTSSVLTKTFTDWLTRFREWAGTVDGQDAWSQAAGHGLLALPVPVDRGGAGAGYEATCLAFETMAEETRSGGLPFAMSAQLWACQEPIRAFGGEEHAARLAGLMAGDLIGAFAATEPDAGSDLLGLRTSARREIDGRWRLDGTKIFVTNGPIADLFLVLARTSAGSTVGGLTAFLLPRTTPGLKPGPTVDKAALAGARFGSLWLDDCVVDENACLGGVGAGFAVFLHAMRYERAFILAPTLGLMAAALRAAVTHARTRHQSGHPIGDYDTIRERIVRMHLRLTSAREVLYGTARAADRGELDHVRASLTKLHVSTEFSEFCHLLPDLYGGYALLPDTGVPSLVADAVASRQYSGTSDMQTKIIAEGLGL